MKTKIHLIGTSYYREVEIEKESEHSVWIKGRSGTERKKGVYFDNIEEAKDFVKNQYQEMYFKAQRQADYFKDKMKFIHLTETK